MKKMLLVFFVVLAMVVSVPAFAADVEIDNSPGAVGNKGTISAPITTFSPSAVGVAGNVVGIAPGGVVLSPSGGAGGAGGSVIGSGNSAVGNGIGNFSPSSSAKIGDVKATVGNVSATGGNVTNNNTNKIETGAVKNTNTVDVNIGGGFLSKTLSPEATANQQQKMNNDQVIAPTQTTDIKIEAPKQNLLGLPSQSVPELNFGNGRMKDATSDLPNFAIYGIKPLKSEAISAVLSVNANVKFKRLYQAILDDAAAVANGGKKTLADVRYQIIQAEAQKSWSTGGNIGGGGSGLTTNGLGGGSGSGSLVPSFGGTKADDLFTVIFVKVVL